MRPSPKRTRGRSRRRRAARAITPCYFRTPTRSHRATFVLESSDSSESAPLENTPARAGTWPAPRRARPCPPPRRFPPRGCAGARGVRLTRKMQAGPCIPAGIQLEKAGVGPTSGPTRRLSHLARPHARGLRGPGRPRRQRVQLEHAGLAGGDHASVITESSRWWPRLSDRRK